MWFPRNQTVSVMCLMVLALPAAADSLPPAVRACIGEADPARRLACYDREVARVIAPPGTFAPTTTTAAAASPLGTPVTQPTPAHVIGKVRTVHSSGDRLVVTLEDGSVWEQSAPATSELNLRSGDTAHVDHEMANWFLSDRYGNTVQVRLRQP